MFRFESKKIMRLTCFICLLFLWSCNQEMDVVPLEVSSLEIYLPEFILEEMENEGENSQWSMTRKKESEHFVVFWEEGFGNQPNSSSLPEEMRVDIDDLLAQSEAFYTKNLELGFVQTGNQSSYLDTYKFLIFLHYTDEWLATGAGYDDIIGALWISPLTTQPAGSVIAHEIGHAFQYMVYCDNGDGSGYRYGFGPDGSGGNGFWEQTANYQAYKCLPENTFNEADCFMEQSNKHFMHEDIRYCSYWLHFYWEEKHGIDFIGKLWRDSRKPEDPVQAYMRITGINLNEFYKEMYDAASRLITWDLNLLRNTGQNYLDLYSPSFQKLGANSYQISKDNVPSTTGFNGIKLKVPESGTTLSTSFSGLPNADGYHQLENPENAGWRMGYVALLSNNERVYSPMEVVSGTQTKSISFVVPNNCTDLWLVVLGAHEKYTPRIWVDPPIPEEHLPYTLSFTNTDLY
ncbi:MAG: hypothetical protein RLZZ248_1691 [Bacteroidota bacterium]|jgi:hypothetical protein